LALLANDPSCMVVNFVTGSGKDCHFGIPVVKYGPVMSSTLQFQKLGSTDTYKASDMCQAPANETAPGKFSSPGCLHSIVMDRLEPNNRYWYKVGLEADQHGGVLEWSNVYEFTSAPTVENQFEPFAFLAYGDQGCPASGWRNGAEMVARMVEAELQSAWCTTLVTCPMPKALLMFGMSGNT
jgi:hypothetical protein